MNRFAAVFPLSSSLSATASAAAEGGKGRGENSPKAKFSRTESPKLVGCGISSLSAFGGEGWGEEAFSVVSPFGFIGRVGLGSSATGSWAAMFDSLFYNQSKFRLPGFGAQAVSQVCNDLLL